MAITTAQGKSSQLELELDRYLKSYSHDPKSRIFAPLGETYRKLGKLEEAIDILEEGIKNHPNYASGHITLGRCFSDKSDSKKAIESFEKAIKFSPDNIMAYRLLISECKKTGDESSLTDIYRKLLTLVPGDREATEFLVAKGLMPKPIVVEKKAPPVVPLKRAEVKNETPAVKKAPDSLPGPVVDKNPAPPAPKLEPVQVHVVRPAVTPAEPILPKPVASEKLTAQKEEQGGDVSRKKNLEFYTMTLAEIYLKQGQKKEAIEIYEVLLEGDTENRVYKNALQKIRGEAVAVPKAKVEFTPPPEVKAEPPVKPAEDSQLKAKPFSISKEPITPRADLKVEEKVGKLSSLLTLITARKRQR